jgi:hypothetical protein
MSAIFYRFKSQRQDSRLPIDGTGISVFDLKKEIILTNQMGDGKEFDLGLYDQNGEGASRPVIHLGQRAGRTACVLEADQTLIAAQSTRTTRSSSRVRRPSSSAGSRLPGRAAARRPCTSPAPRRSSTCGRAGRSARWPRRNGHRASCLSEASPDGSTAKARRMRCV